MFTQQEITWALDIVLGHVTNGWVFRNIVDYQEFGHKSPLDGAKKAIGIGGFASPGRPTVSWDPKGIRISSDDWSSERLVSHAELVKRAYELSDVDEKGQLSLF